MAEPAIIQRLEATLERIRDEQAEVRSINLCQTDRDALDAAMTARFNEGYPRDRRMKLHVLSYGEHPVRLSKTSIIYSTTGWPFTIKRLSKQAQAQ